MSEIEKPDEDARADSPQPLKTRATKDGKEKTSVDDEVIIPELDPDIEDRIIRQVLMQAEQYSSPHPHPDHLERYAALYPKAPEIVFEQFREQGDHRRAMERKYMGGSERRANIGQWLAFGLVAAAIAAGVFVAQLTDSAGAGATIISVALGGGILLAISGAKSEKKSTVVQGAPTRRRKAGLGTESAKRPLGDAKTTSDSPDAGPTAEPSGR